MTKLPVEEVLPALADALKRSGNAVLCAPPGAGKTTAVPGFLLEKLCGASGKIIMLEPRRIAARSSAKRIAALLHGKVGGIAGYRTRSDTKISSETRIEIVTEGILTRMLQEDPSLDGYSIVIFDEFHERSLQGDLALALTCDAKKIFREDLRILVMSATLDSERISRLLDNAPVVKSEGKMFPVETVYRPVPTGVYLENAVISAVKEALEQSPGDVLVFLPGESEIRRCVEKSTCFGDSIAVHPLYGNLPSEQQDEVLAPDSEGRRKVIFSTPVAETSLTVPGVTSVVDSGYVRVPKFSPRNGMSRLETERISLASADQRRGRAGRLAPGLCIRLWSQGEHGSLKPFAVPGIMESDLAPLRLELARWGTKREEIPALRWLDIPPASKLDQAEELLLGLNAMDGKGNITPHGNELLKIPLHPRLAHAVTESEKLFHGGFTACRIAALLEERELIPGQGSDMRELLTLLDRGPASARAARIRESAAQAARSAHVAAGKTDISKAGMILALAYPDRIGMTRSRHSGEYILSNGTGARLRKGDTLLSCDFLACAAVEGEGTRQVIFTAAPVPLEEIERYTPGRIHETFHIAWNSGEKALSAERRTMLGKIVLSSRPAPGDVPVEELDKAFLDGLRSEGAAVFAFEKSENALRSRIAFLRKNMPEEEFPDLSDEGLLNSMDTWLLPFSSGMTRVSQLKKIDMKQALLATLTRRQRTMLDTEAPERIQVPSGSMIRLEYDTADGIPLLPVKLQEIFGMMDTPRLASGRVPVVMEILSPAMCPIQVTRDLKGFWSGSYFLVRKDMRGRYPKHHWPEDPLQAVASRNSCKKIVKQEN